jgi:hypothetical protein
MEMYRANFIKWNAGEYDKFEELRERLCGHGNAGCVRLLAGETKFSDGWQRQAMQYSYPSSFICQTGFWLS